MYMTRKKFFGVSYVFSIKLLFLTSSRQMYRRLLIMNDALPHGNWAGQAQ